MKNIKQLLMLVTTMLSLTSFDSAAGIKNAKTVSLKVSGNCEMCKKRIDAAATKKNVAQGDWNADSKMLSLTFDSKKSTADQLLKQVAYAGYDNEKFMAPDEAYSDLPGCCQYERRKSAVAAIEAASPETVQASVMVEDVNSVAGVETAYFGLKDALTKDDAKAASEKAKELFKAIDKVKMDKMSAEQHKAWMSLKDKLSYDAEHIKGTNELEHQREHFMALSKNMYELIRVFKASQPVYYQHCPMANGGKGADWLSMDEKISNPYYGNSMSTCGKTTEIIK
ncbi:MAG: mercury transporter [Bacteroidetes bacterium]|nr:mercury transporter [Bacteroidota bacterium]